MSSLAAQFVPSMSQVDTKKDFNFCTVADFFFAQKTHSGKLEKSNFWLILLPCLLNFHRSDKLGVFVVNKFKILAQEALYSLRWCKNYILKHSICYLVDVRFKLNVDVVEISRTLRPTRLKA